MTVKGDFVLWLCDDQNKCDIAPIFYVGKLNDYNDTEIGGNFKASKLKNKGTHTIKVQYGKPLEYAETTFNYVELKSIMKIKSELGITQDVPAWVNITFNFYLAQPISEEELITELEYLIKQEIIY